MSKWYLTYLLEDFNLETVEFGESHDYCCECDEKCEEEKAHLLSMSKGVEEMGRTNEDVAIEFAPLGL